MATIRCPDCGEFVFIRSRDDSKRCKCAGRDPFMSRALLALGGIEPEHPAEREPKDLRTRAADWFREKFARLL